MVPKGDSLGPDEPNSSAIQKSSAVLCWWRRAGGALNQQFSPGAALASDAGSGHHMGCHPQHPSQENKVHLPLYFSQRKLSLWPNVSLCYSGRNIFTSPPSLLSLPLLASSAAQIRVWDRPVYHPPDSLYLFPVLILSFLDLTPFSFWFHCIVWKNTSPISQVRKVSLDGNFVNPCKCYNVIILPLHWQLGLNILDRKSTSLRISRAILLCHKASSIFLKWHSIFSFFFFF